MNPATEAADDAAQLTKFLMLNLIRGFLQVKMHTRHPYCICRQERLTFYLEVHGVGQADWASPEHMMYRVQEELPFKYCILLLI